MNRSELIKFYLEDLDSRNFRDGTSNVESFSTGKSKIRLIEILSMLRCR